MPDPSIFEPDPLDEQALLTQLGGAPVSPVESLDQNLKRARLKALTAQALKRAEAQAKDEFVGPIEPVRAPKAEMRASTPEERVVDTLADDPVQQLWVQSQFQGKEKAPPGPTAMRASTMTERIGDTIGDLVTRLKSAVQPDAEYQRNTTVPEPFHTTLDPTMGSAAPGEVMTKAAMSKAPLSELASGLWHPIGAGKKLERPLSQMEFGVTPHANTRGHRAITPAEMEGATIIPLTGDRARAQATLTRVGDVPLRNPVPLPGGPDFMLEKPGSGWASARAPIEKLAKKVREGGDGRTFGMYVPGSHAMVDFSTTFADALLEQVSQSPVTKKGMQRFDAEVRRLRPEWKGLAHPDARKQLDANGELRLAFTNAMGLSEFRKAGFPDLATTRAAISEPALMNTRPYEGGFAIAELDPGGKVIRQPESPHPTYTTELGGQYAGQFKSDVPIADLFPTFTQARRQSGADPMRDVRSFMLSNPTQVATPQWVDSVSKILGNAPPRVVDYLKKYGIAGALAAGLINESQARQLQAQQGQEQQ